MKVYRYLRQDELENILADRIDRIGYAYNLGDERVEKYKRVNTHKYAKKVKYLHFFKNKEDIKRVQNLNFYKPGDYYICEFNIPFLILMSGIGFGRYDTRGYDKYFDSVLEFKMPAEYMKRTYLKKYELDTRHCSVSEGLLFGDDKKPFEFDRRIFEPIDFSSISQEKQEESAEQREQ